MNKAKEFFSTHTAKQLKERISITSLDEVIEEKEPVDTGSFFVFRVDFYISSENK